MVKNTSCSCIGSELNFQLPHVATPPKGSDIHLQLPEAPEHQCTDPYRDTDALFKKFKSLGWRDGSEVKSTGFSSRGPEFNSQQPHGGSRPSVMESDTCRQIQIYRIKKEVCLKCGGKTRAGQAWWHTPLIPALRRQSRWNL